MKDTLKPKPNTQMTDTNNNSEHQPSERLLRIIAMLKDCKGQFLSVTMEKDETPNAASKKAGVRLRKRTKMVVRTGVSFANLASVKEGIASGERGEVGELPWGKWFIYPYAIINGGKEYVRFTLGANTRPTCEYEVNDTPASRDEFLQHLPPSKRVSKEPSEVITVALENIVSIG